MMNPGQAIRADQGDSSIPAAAALVNAAGEKLNALHAIVHDTHARLLPALQAQQRAIALRAALDGITHATTRGDVPAHKRLAQHAHALLAQLADCDDGALAAEISAVRRALDLATEPLADE
jgi:hypothetical protein